MTIEAHVRDPRIGGTIQVVELRSRKRAFVRASKVAGVFELKSGGPTRLLFDAGGHIDIYAVRPSIGRSD